MNPETKIMAREVWSRAIRIAHACLLTSTLGLMLTGWLVSSAPSLAHTASEVHHLLGVLFTVSLGFRFILLFTDGHSGHWKRMVQAWPKPKMVGEMLIFYATFGRSKLPKWYAHNFMWVPLYFILFGILFFQTLTGILMIYDVFIFGIYPPKPHHFFASAIFWFTLFHLYAVILHDMKSNNGNISAMINGRRYFEADLGARESKTNSISINISDIKSRLGQ